MGGQYIEPMWQRAAARVGAHVRARSEAHAAATLPGQCEICHRWGDDRLCGACLAQFAPPRPRCARCGLVTGMPLATCGQCLAEPPPFRAAVVAFDYGFPWDGLIGRFKFDGAAELGRALAPPLVAAVRARRAQAPGEPWPSLAIPVPLARERLAERGFNQAWEIARHVGRALGVPARADLLVRALPTAHQAGLDRAARERNLRAAFMVPPSARAAVLGCEVALVDDVVTTGATAREAAAVLLRAGAAGVTLWALARTPAPDG